MSEQLSRLVDLCDSDSPTATTEIEALVHTLEASSTTSSVAELLAEPMNMCALREPFRMDVFKLLVRLGARPSLHEIAWLYRTGDACEAFATLRQVDFNFQLDTLNASASRAGQTLLQYYAQSNILFLLQWLIDHGVDVDQRDAQGRTALWFANYGQHVEAARILFRAGASAQRISQRSLAWSRPMQMSDRPEPFCQHATAIVQGVLLCVTGMEFEATIHQLDLRALSIDRELKKRSAPLSDSQAPPIAMISVDPSLDQGHERVVIDGTRVTFNSVCAVVSSVPLRPIAGFPDIVYFEVKILKHAEQVSATSTGFTSSSLAANRHIGWDDDSVGVHSDDGALFSGFAPNGAAFTSKFGPGDVFGAGCHLSTKELFFTLNGAFVGGRAGVQIDFGRLQAAVCSTAGDEVDINLGQSPFVFSFAASQLRWSRQVLKGPMFRPNSHTMLSLGDSALVLDHSTGLFEGLQIVGSPDHWLAKPLSIAGSGETLVGFSSATVTPDLTVYSARRFASDPCVQLHRLVWEPSPHWQLVEPRDQSPSDPPTTTLTRDPGLEFHLASMGDDLLVWLCPHTTEIFCFDLRSSCWFGPDQIRGDVSLLWTTPSFQVASLPTGGCLVVGSNFFCGYIALLEAQRIVVNDAVGVKFLCSSPHSTGLRPTLRLHLSIAAHPDGRVVLTGGWDGFKRMSDVDIGVLSSNTTPQTRLSRSLTFGSFSDIVLEAADGVTFAAHKIVLRRRVTGIKFADDAAIVRVAATSAHLRLLLQYAYADSLPTDLSLSSDETRAFVFECVEKLAPQHCDRVMELLVSIAVATPSRFAADFADAFAVTGAHERGAPVGFDGQLLLGDGRVAHVHRALLTATSTFFQAAFEGAFAKSIVDCTDTDAPLVLAVVQFLCSGDVVFDDELSARVVDLLAAAIKLGCMELADRCDGLIVPLVDADNASWLKEMFPERAIICKACDEVDLEEDR